MIGLLEMRACVLPDAPAPSGGPAGSGPASCCFSPDDASDREGDAFYRIGHFAVGCLAQTCGERKKFDFVPVPRACVRWIRKRA